MEVDARAARRDLDRLVAALRWLDKDSRKVLRDSSKSIAARLADEIRQAGDAAPARSRYLISRTRVRAVSKDYPQINIKGPLLGAGEFGARRSLRTRYRAGRWGRRHAAVTVRRTQRQFAPYKKAGYWIYPTWEDAAPELAARWVDAAGKAMQGGLDGRA